MSTQDETDLSAKDSEGVEEEVAAAEEPVDGESSGDEAVAAELTPAEELAQAKAEAEGNYERYLRAAAELENFRKRTVKMRVDARDETLRDVLSQIAPLMDNMRRALAQEVADDAFKQGFQLILAQFQDMLKGYGLEEIEAVGNPFDPNIHEAMLEVESPDHPAGIVIEEMGKGYMLRGRIMRPTRVIVSKKSEAAEDIGTPATENDD
jgi:molecular chaperone GrpE